MTQDDLDRWRKCLAMGSSLTFAAQVALLAEVERLKAVVADLEQHNEEAEACSRRIAQRLKDQT